MGCCSHKELGTMIACDEREIALVTVDCHHAALLNSHGCTFADSGEHYKLEDSPEGA